ncbi:hypothetical protein ACROYT_G038862 [Oculina patagonica]
MAAMMTSSLPKLTNLWTNPLRCFHLSTILSQIRILKRPICTTSDYNPFLNQEALPRFSEFRTSHVVPAIEKLVHEFETDFTEFETKLEDNNTKEPLIDRPWSTIIEPLEKIGSPLSYAWGVTSHLNGVRNSQELRTAYEKVQPLVVQASMKASQSVPLYDALGKVEKNDESLDEGQQRVVSTFLRSARNGGVALKGKDKERFNAIQLKLAELGNKFSNNVLDATKAFSLVLTDPEDVAGLPESLLQMTAEAAAADSELKGSRKKVDPKTGPWKVSLDLPCFEPFMKYSQNRSLREKMYMAYITRASQGDTDNSEIIEEIRKLRQEKATLLGFENFAYLSLDSKMAESPTEVWEMIINLKNKSKAAAQTELLTLQQIDGDMIREAALRTKGSGGPSGVDANGFKRILACKSFKKSSANLCDALAKTARRLNTDFVDPRTIEPFLANRLIPLDKGEGAVRPIGVGEVIRRVIGKCVMKVTKQDVIEASGSLQVCAGLKSGSEAAVHAIHSIFEADETDAVLLIDASNAFNALNRAAALHNIRVLCPPIATYAINTYREPARLFIIGGKEIKSAEGTTQGDPLAMGIYAISLQPLITRLGISNDLKQCWFADDASGAGSLEDIKRWWDVLTEAGPDLGYYPNAKKCWLITKPDKKDHAKAIFEGTAINISTQGQKHLGAALGSRAYLEEYVDGKVEEWVSQVVKLAEYATSNPQACYAAFTFGLRHRWTYFLRTLPDIEDLLEPLERAIADVLIPSITDHHCTKEERDLVALPVRLGGLGLINPSQDAASQFKVSTKITAPLVEKIIAQDHETPADTAVKTLQQCVRRETNEALQTRLGNVRESLPQKTQRAIDLATEKGASNWLTVLPLKDMGYNLNKGEFRDAVKLRYDWEIDDKPTVCVCGDAFTIDHAMICRRGGFIIQRHNELRDLEADLLKMVCNDVEIEPVLQELTGERLPSGANTTPDARLDIHARGFWEKQRSAFFDVRVCHPNADSYKDQTPKQIYRNHENEKKRAYADRVLQVEQGTFTPLVFTSTGGMGEECKRYHSRLAELIAAKKGEDYATTVSWIRSKVSFAILRSALICLRGSRTVKRNRNI